MDAEIKQKWVEALRSGKYEQGKHFLHRGEKWCCLGVLADLICPKSKQEFTDDIGVSFDGSNGFLSGDLMLSCGMEAESQNRLACMNDDLQPFSEIADYIEATL